MSQDAEMLRVILAKADGKLARAEKSLADGDAGDAASRAYYAAFHAVTAVLATRRLSFSSHKETISAFNREFVISGVFPPHFSKHLRRLFQDRQIADYEWARSVDAQTGTEDVAAARELVVACREYVERSIRGHATESANEQ